MRNYCIYFSQGFFFNGDVVKKSPEFFTKEECVRALIRAKKIMDEKSTLLQKMYVPTIRKVSNRNPIRFCNEEVQQQYSLIQELSGQTNLNL